MTDIETTSDIETEEFSEELSDEILDRMPEGRITIGSGPGSCHCNL